MFAEFGQSPLCLDIDLDSYEGSWTHVAMFRGGSGWLHVARATIQSEHDLLRADLIAACDEQGNAIPAWRAAHLTQCGWSRLEPCFEEPPALLDDLLCEEEGGFYARWQREMNGDLALLFDRAQRRIEALEARANAQTRIVERQIADLRRRRRLPDCPIEARIALGAVIADLEEENDAAIADLTEQRAALRREAEAAEEALWQRTDVLIEIEPQFTVRWRAGCAQPESRPARIWREGTYYASARPFSSRWDAEGAATVLAKFQTAMEASAAKAAVERAVTKLDNASKTKLSALPKKSAALRKLDENALVAVGCGAAAQEKPRALPHPVLDAKEQANVLKRREKLEVRAQRLRHALALPGSHPKWRLTIEGKLDRLERTIADIDDRRARIPAELPLKPVADETVPAVRIVEDDDRDQRPAPETKLDLERAMLAGMLEDLVEQGHKYLPGSPKTRQNLEDRAELEREITKLDRLIASANGSGAGSELDPVERNWTTIEVDALRRLWMQGLSAGEIARTIGRVSRNAVIGKAKRLGLPMRAQADLSQRQSGQDQLTGQP